MGAKPVMLLCQNMPLIFGRSASLRNAPSVGGLRLTPPISTIERIFLRGDNQIRADGAKFAIDLVPDIGRNGNHRRGNGHTERNGRACQQLAPLLPSEGFVNQPDEHRLLLCEHAATSRNVRLLDNYRVRCLRGF